jgi:two-component system, LytTR family, sensor kinase
MTTADSMARRPVRELFAIAMALIAIWLVAGLFTASEFYRRSIAQHGKTEEFIYIMGVQTVSGLIWATVTPVLIAIAERLPLRRPVLVRNALILIALLPVIAIARAVIGSVVLNLGEHHGIQLTMMHLSISIRTHRNIAMTALIFVVTNLVMAQRESAARARRELAAQALLAHAELDELRAHVQPHFLFLTLRTIAEVLHVNPAAADDMIVGLADLLRRGLALGNNPVPLAEELEFVDRNLALYQICFGGRLQVRFDADEDVLTARVPPLLVQQLVENAVVSGIAPAGRGAIAIRGWRDGEQLRTSVSDSGSGLLATSARDDARGLAPVRTRLEKLFGSAQSLTFGRENGHCVAAVSLPFDDVVQPAPVSNVSLGEAVGEGL